MTDADVLVLGRGLGARAAALAAATADPSADVVLLGGTDRPFDRHPGLVGVLGERPDRRGPVADPFEAIGALPTDHPYRVLGRDALRAGLRLFDDAVGDDYAGAHTDANALLPTLLGYPTPAARYPREVAAGRASLAVDAQLVGFREVPDFHAPLAAERLGSADVPFDVEAATATAPLDPGDGPPALTVARALDENDAVGARDEPAREAVAGTLASVYDGAGRVGLPAVLGLAAAGDVHASLAAEVDADVFEVPLGPPSVPGRRLASTLRRALDDAGVTVHLDCEVAGVETGSGAVDRVTVDGEAGPSSVTAGAVVLATGGPGEGGLVASRDGVREPVVGCHVPQPDSRSGWTRADPLGDHALASMGVRVDESARPLTADGEPVLENLFAAGAILGGHDGAGEGSRDGVALASGRVAGTRAAEH